MDIGYERVLQLAVDYAEAAFEHGREQAKYEAARVRTAAVSDAPVREAGMKATRAYAALRLALPIPLMTASKDPGE